MGVYRGGGRRHERSHEITVYISYMQIQFKLVVYIYIYIYKILFDYTAKQIQTTQHKTKTNNTKIHIKQNSILKEQNSVNKKATT